MPRHGIFLLLTIAAFGWCENGFVTFCAVGDVMLARDVAKKMKQDGNHAPFQDISPILKNHDIALCNLECQISTRGFPSAKPYRFKVHPDQTSGLLESGFNVFGLANNHIADYGLVALMDTRRFLEKKGFKAGGVGSNRWEALRPIMLDINDLRIAIFSFAAFWPSEFDCRLPRCPQAAKPDSTAIRHLIRKARPISDIVIVSFHWGKEYKHYPTEAQKRFARICIDAGADLIIGHHPHVIQTIEKYDGKFILYSLGNCIFDQDFSQMTREGLLLSCVFDRKGVASAEVIPLFISDCRPSPATGKDFSRIEKKLRTYSAGSGVTLTSENGRIILE